MTNNSAPSYIHTGLDGIDGRCDEGCCVGAGADGQPCSCDDGCDDFSNMWKLSLLGTLLPLLSIALNYLLVPLAPGRHRHFDRK